MVKQSYPLAANSYSYIHAGPARECMAHLAKRGFSSFELMIYPGHFWPDQLSKNDRSELRNWLRGEGLSIASLNPPSLDINLASVTPEMRRLSQDIYGKTVQLAADVDCPIVVLTPGKKSPLFPAPQEQMLGHLYEGFDYLVPLAKDVGTRCVLENVPIGILPTLKETLKAVEDYGRPELGIVYDVANAAFIGENVVDGLMACGSRLAAIHLSDTSATTWGHDPVGTGVVPFKSIPATLRDLNYKGPKILEIASKRNEIDIIESADKLVLMGLT